jgi:hypothetical protein
MTATTSLLTGYCLSCTPAVCFVAMFDIEVLTKKLPLNNTLFRYPSSQVN